MRVMSTDKKSHITKTSERCLNDSVREGNKIYLEACLQQRRHFSPFVISVDELLGVEAEATLKIIASHSQPPHNKVSATKLIDVWIRPEQDYYHFDAVHTPVHLGIQGAYTQDQCETPTVKRWHRTKPFPVGTPKKTTHGKKPRNFIKRYFRPDGPRR